MQESSNRRLFLRLCIVACLSAVIVIGMGAFTRLVDAGLGCPDWPGCYGHLLWPDEAHEVERANQAWPDAPVEHDKTWPEMVHRYLATGLGLLAIISVGLAWRGRSEGGPVKLPLFILAFIILQGMFGMWTVTLKLWPQVVTAHLLGGFTTFALFWLLALRLRGAHWPLSERVQSALPGLRRLAVIGLVVTVLQITLGGWTTSNYAAVACPDFPTCQNQWLPDMDFKQGFDVTQEVGPNYLGGAMANEARMAIHFSHRIGALITTVLLLMLAWRLWRSEWASARSMAPVLMVVLGLQVLLGIGNVVLQFPLWVAVAHNLGGAFLLLTLVTINYGLWTAREPH